MTTESQLDAHRILVPTSVNFETTFVPVNQSHLVRLDPVQFGGSEVLQRIAKVALEVGIQLDDWMSIRGTRLLYVAQGVSKQSDVHVLYSTQDIVAIKQINLYYSEVVSTPAITTEDMARRLALAQKTGFLLMWPDEAWAVCRKLPDSSYVFTDSFENNDLGVIRSLSMVARRTGDGLSGQKSIAGMDKQEVAAAYREALGDFMWWSRPGMPISAVQHARLSLTVKMLALHEKIAPEERTQSGAIRRKSLLLYSDLESVSGQTKSADGWVTYPTWQDSAYNGVFCNPRTFQVLTYSEGDLIEVLCENQNQFDAEMAALAEFYGTRRKPTSYALNANGTELMFDTLTFLRGNVRTVMLKGPREDSNEQASLSVPLVAHIKIDSPVIAAARDGEVIELRRDAFEVDLLNPLAFRKYEAHLHKAFGRQQVVVKICNDEADLMAFLD